MYSSNYTYSSNCKCVSFDNATMNADACLPTKLFLSNLIWDNRGNRSWMKPSLYASCSRKTRVSHGGGLLLMTIRSIVHTYTRVCSVDCARTTPASRFIIAISSPTFKPASLPVHEGVGEWRLEAVPITIFHNNNNLTEGAAERMAPLVTLAKHLETPVQPWGSE